MIGLPTIKNLDILDRDWPQLHSIVKDWECKECGRYFDDPQDWKMHMKKVHRQAYKPTCYQCQSKFTMSEEKQEHFNRFHLRNRAKGNIQVSIGNENRTMIIKALRRASKISVTINSQKSYISECGNIPPEWYKNGTF